MASASLEPSDPVLGNFNYLLFYLWGTNGTLYEKKTEQLLLSKNPETVGEKRPGQSRFYAAIIYCFVQSSKPFFTFKKCIIIDNSSVIWVSDI